MQVIIVFNAGSSSLKFSIYDRSTLQIKYYGMVDNVIDAPHIQIKDADSQEVYANQNIQPGSIYAMQALLHWLNNLPKKLDIVVAGHRVVHGGKLFSKPQLINAKVLSQLKSLIPLAPLHQPYNIAPIEEFAKQYPEVPQVVCFDTAFHRSQLPEAELFAIPLSYADEGVVRYGFHGLSYEYIASVLPQYTDINLNTRIIVAHLGNGASMCAMHNLRSQASTMGFTALEGLMMGTRSGSIDPGVIFYLLQEKSMQVDEVIKLLYKQSGLKGVSGNSHDIRVLLDSEDQQDQQAISLFCYLAASKLSSLIPAINGLDCIVFTAGIGENSWQIRAKICENLQWLGITLDSQANAANQQVISVADSKVQILVLPTNEEQIIAKHSVEFI